MIYTVIGTGAIGGYYGAKLAFAGNEVHFLLHSDYEYVKNNGLYIKSYDGDFSLPCVNAHCSTEDIPKSDVVIVALKSVNNCLLTSLLPPIIKEDTIVLLIQNGIGLEEDLLKVFPQLQIVAGLAFICSAKTQPGIINHQFYGSINIGNYSCKDTERFEIMITEMGDAGIKTAVVEYNEARWKKAVWNMPFNGMTVAMNAQTNELLEHLPTRELIREQMLEVIGAAQALGVKNIDISFADKMIESTLNMVPYSPSMKLDFDFHRPMEIYYLYTRPIEEAYKAGFMMPRLSMLETELKFIERKQSLIMPKG
ncbi:MAG: 2-dehydropantoate 2-reductase [Prevotella sp.]